VKFELQETIGKYPIIREIGSGATSRVYLARDPFAEREVAIKVLLPGKGADAETDRMMHKSFMTEASLAGKLNHPHIVDIYDAVIETERSYLVMEYVPGVTLEAHSSVSTLLPSIAARNRLSLENISEQSGSCGVKANVRRSSAALPCLPPPAITAAHMARASVDELP